MSENEITLALATGAKWFGWKDASIVRSIEQAASTFQFKGVFDRGVGELPVRLETPCEIFIGDEKVLTGIVETVDARGSASEVSLTIAGRSKTKAAIKNAALLNGKASGQIRRQSLKQIAEKLCAEYGIALSVEVDTGDPFRSFVIEEGETVFEAIDRLARMRAVYVTDNADGELVLTRAGSDELSTALVRGPGGNVEGGGGSFSSAEVYSEVRCKGQRAGNDEDNGSTVSAVQSIETDDIVATRQVLVIPAETQADKQRCQDRARHELASRVAQSVNLNYHVQGFRQSEGGDLWRDNAIVMLTDPVVDIESARLLVASLTFSIGAGGRRTTFDLKPPDAYKKEPQPGKKSVAGISIWHELEEGVEVPQ